MADNRHAAPAAGGSQGEFLGHPKGLYVLFMTEMWERFSYYGMRALLIFYLTQHWLFSDGKASIIYGAYTSLVYITPVLGGYLADKYLGQRKAVLFGAILLTCGHILMAFEGTGGQGDPTINIFWLALSFIIVGSGFLKANISVIVGQLYSLTDVRRDGAYTIFYMGINVGAAIGTLVAGYLGQTYGWKYGFGAAGFGMFLGLLVFIWKTPLLMGRGESPNPEKLAQRIGGVLKLEWLLYLLSVASVGLIWTLIQYQGVVGWLLMGSGVVLLGYVLVVAITKLTPQERDRIFAVVFLIALQPLFWGLFEQAGSSLNLFTDRYVDRAGVPASIFQSLNPIYIVLFGPVFAWLWVFLGKRGLEPSTPAKFGIGIVQLGLGFLVLVGGAHMVGLNMATPVVFIFLIYLLHTTGELCLSPVGLSAMNRLAPKHMASLIMGAWFFATAGGNFVGGLIAQATGGGHAGGTDLAKESVLQVYTTIGLVAIGVGVAVMVIAPLVKRLMHLDTLKDSELAGYEEMGEAQSPGMHPELETKPRPSQP
ncbi:putative transporter YclF [Iodidimonas muriae]|uniref:Transporter YclF n=1 Tax=Iodidimonas muriae TaxID=261467 RepID=A0ABQ2LF00_9PROT|nr:peptide MFS transporter [Iodidimonas muriae]GER07451.1 putative transporter YclF [Kordiimonadales bacterium JCM 17843]GGO14421.1 putative transporter YclF [Iodidimonas muriae]